MPVSGPRMRQKLAKSAFQLFAKRGIKNVNLDEIAAHAGVTKGSLYWHYKSKKEVILAACEHYYDSWQKRTDAAIAVDDDPLQQFERVIRASVQSCLFDRKNRVFTSEVLALSLQDADVLAARARFAEHVSSTYACLLQTACDRGQIQVANPRLAVDMLIAIIDGIKQRAAFDPKICTAKQSDELVARLLRVLPVAS